MWHNLFLFAHQSHQLQIEILFLHYEPAGVGHCDIFKMYRAHTKFTECPVFPSILSLPKTIWLAGGNCSLHHHLPTNLSAIIYHCIFIFKTPFWLKYDVKQKNLWLFWLNVCYYDEWSLSVLETLKLCIIMLTALLWEIVCLCCHVFNYCFTHCHGSSGINVTYNSNQI